MGVLLERAEVPDSDFTCGCSCGCSPPCARVSSRSNGHVKWHTERQRIAANAVMTAWHGGDSFHSVASQLAMASRLRCRCASCGP
jgi:hypothetical protein